LVEEGGYAEPRGIKAKGLNPPTPLYQRGLETYLYQSRLWMDYLD
jgi:hypothetical protein